MTARETKYLFTQCILTFCKACCFFPKGFFSRVFLCQGLLFTCANVMLAVLVSTKLSILLLLLYNIFNS